MTERRWQKVLKLKSDISRLPSSTVHGEVVQPQMESATAMLSAMIYPLWHWELLWQPARPNCDTSGCQSSQDDGSSYLCLGTPRHIFVLIHHLESELHSTSHTLHPIDKGTSTICTELISATGLTPDPPSCLTFSFAHLPFPSLHPPGIRQFLLRCINCLNPLLRRMSRMTAPCFQAWDLNSCGHHYGPISPGHFFSPSSSGSWDPHHSPPRPPPPSCCLLLFPSHSHELCKHWGFVCSCCGEPAV